VFNITVRCDIEHIPNGSPPGIIKLPDKFREKENEMKRLIVKQEAKAAMLLAALPAMWSLTAPVQAGEWEMHYECNGKQTLPQWHSNGADPYAMSPEEQQLYWQWMGPVTKDYWRDINKVKWWQSVGPWNMSSYDPVSRTALRNVTAVFEWKPAAGQTLQSDPPPPKLTVLVSSVADSHVMLVDYSEPGSPTRGVPEATRNANSSAGGPLTDNGVNKNQNGKRLITKTVPTSGTNAGKVRFEASPEAFFSLPTNWPGRSHMDDNLSAGVNVEVGVAKDNRSLGLTRVGAIGEWEDSDGNLHGDTTYSYVTQHLGEPSASANYPNVQTFVASLLGGWSPNNQFVFVPQPEQVSLTDNGFSGNYTMPYGNLAYHWRFGWDGEPTGVSERVYQCTVTDEGDGAVATTRYFLKIHDPIERSGDEETNVDAPQFHYGEAAARKIWLPKLTGL
jgi:hypothetical protein